LKALQVDEKAFDTGLVKLIESEFNETKSQVMKDKINKVLEVERDKDAIKVDGEKLQNVYCKKGHKMVQMKAG
jgi:hypothetical protein